jgi:hypothetical protein
MRANPQFGSLCVLLRLLCALLVNRNRRERKEYAKDPQRQRRRTNKGCGIDKCWWALEINRCHFAMFPGRDTARGGSLMRHIVLVITVAIVGMVVLAACKSTDQLISTRSNPSTSPTPGDGIRRITVSELQSLVNKNEAFIVDVRSEDAYKTAHIKGAKLMPLNEILNHTGELPKDKLIVTYCS